MASRKTSSRYACAECGQRVRADQYHPIESCLKRLQRENKKLRAALRQGAEGKK